jgi:hypothetical protein
MLRAVLDTNVLFSALLSRRGASFEIFRRLRRGEWRMVLSNHLLLEYEEVLKRNAVAIGFTPAEVDLLPNAICQAADCVALPAPAPSRSRPIQTTSRSCGWRKLPGRGSSPRTTCVISARRRRMALLSCARASFSVS